MSDSGEVTTAWVQEDHARTVIRAARITATGRLGAVVTLSSGAHTADLPAIASSNTATIVVWREQDPRRVMMVSATVTERGWSLALTLAASTPEASETLLGTPGFGPPVVRLSEAGGLVSWTQDGLVLHAVRLSAGGVTGPAFILDRAPRDVTLHTLHARAFDAAVGRPGPSDPLRTPVLTNTPTAVLVAWTSTRYQETDVRVVRVTPTTIFRQPVSRTVPPLLVTPDTARWLGVGRSPLLVAEVSGRARTHALLLWRFGAGAWSVWRRAPSHGGEILVGNQNRILAIWPLFGAGLRQRLIAEPVVLATASSR